MPKFAVRTAHRHDPENATLDSRARSSGIEGPRGRRYWLFEMSHH